MPAYQFQADDGEVIERFYPIREAPPLGAVLRVSGKKFRRIVSLPGSLPDFKPYSTNAIPRRTPGFRHDRRGKPVVENRQQERRYAKRMGYEWTNSKDSN